MDSPILSVGLPLMLAIVMYGLGLSLTLADFRRIATQPKAVLIALICQVLVLPAIAFGLVKVFNLDPILAIGFMLLAASPGGTTANLYSHLFRGDVALNVSLTAINSVLAVVTLPVITNMAIGYFDSEDAGQLSLQFGKMVQVFAVVLVPVALGMATRAKAAGFADRMDRPVRIISVVMLVALVVGAIIGERENVMDYFVDIGAVAILFCVISLSVGYFVPRAFGIREKLAISSAMEIGIHNTTVAMTIAISVMDSVELAVPAAVYSVVMYIFAAAFGYLITRGSRSPDAVVA